uniref:HAT C-terminal dimerisation domain-containing protein n=1 Tax=Pelodiscus sinensis TaxID=13735 RepID=K7F0Z9_PELSI
MCDELNINPIFQEKHLTNKTNMFSYEGNDKPIENTEESYRINYFLIIVDSALVSMKKRFELYENHKNIFGFLPDMKSVKGMDKDTLKKHCMDLHVNLQDGDSCDIEGLDLYEELQNFCRIIPDSCITVHDCLKIICSNNMEDIYPNIYITLRILLTSPMTVASAERSFSKLKLIKNYLRSTMSQERFVGLSIISIKNDLCKEMDFKDIIEECAAKRARQL